MNAEQFRRRLRQEAERWWQEGLIDATLYGQLAERYRFAALETEARSRFTTILLALGGLLLGLSAITLVAANWELWSRPQKLGLLLSVFLSVSVVGFWLWRSRDRGGRHKLGAALLLLSGLLLGANLGLVSQMFHQSGPLYHLLLVWSGGVWLMALSLQMPALAMLSVLLAGSTYVPALFDALRSPIDLWQGVILQMPLLTLLLFLPLAQVCRSPVTFGLAGLLLTGTLTASALIPQSWASPMALLLAPALLWAYGVLPARPWVEPAFQAIARPLALLVLAALLYGLSFNFWSGFRLHPTAVEPWSQWVTLELVLLLAIALGLWLRPGDRWRHWRFWQQPRALNSGTLAVLLGGASLTLLLHLQVVPLPWLGPLVLNGLFFGLAIATLRDSLALSHRPAFWGGLGLLVLGITTRMLEYNTELMLKALVFATVGLGVILAGLWFERQLQAAAAASNLSPAESLPLTED